MYYKMTKILLLEVVKKILGRARYKQSTARTFQFIYEYTGVVKFFSS